MMLGLEGQATWSNMANRFTFSQQGFVSQASERNPWSGDLSARGGIAFDRGLLYAKAGAAAGRFDFSDMDGFGNAFQGSATRMGLLPGGGVEYAFAPNWSAKLEYDHVGYLSRNVPLGPQASTSESATTNTVKVGINYFFGPSAVVVAKD